MCENCHRRCHKHEATYFQKNKSCPKCKAEQEVKDREERDLNRKALLEREQKRLQKWKDFWGLKGGRKGCLRDNKKKTK